MRITIESDGPVTIAPAGRGEANQTADSDTWTVFGVLHAGDPEPLAVVPGRDALAYRNPRWQGGVWDETVMADSPAEAARRGREAARARLADVAWPTQGAA
jgi:hypothetical protein